MGVAIGNMIEPFVNREFHMKQCSSNLAPVMYITKET